MKIFLDEAYRSGCEGRFTDCTVEFLPRSLMSNEEFLAAIQDAEVLGIRNALPFRVDDQFLDAVPRLRFIQKAGTGIDTFDIGSLSRRNILLASNTGFNAVAVAEHTLLLMLLCLHQPRAHMEALRSGEWRQPLPLPTPAQISSKTVGIIGMGAIGARVAQYALSMGAEVVAFMRNQDVTRSSAHAVQLAPLDDLLRRADVVSLHVPLTDETNGMIGAYEFRMMKPGSVLINTSRGKVVDEKALYAALMDGKLAAAGIDVFETEPTQPDNLLLHLDNVYATPHLAGFTIESNDLQIKGTLSNIERFTRGLKPDRLINDEVWVQIND